MTTPARRTTAGPLRTLMILGVVGEEADARLLDLYRSGRPGSEEAFRILVERHGPMVLAVCRGLVPDPAEADDAFQAVFLVLVRRAGGIRKADSLGPWLHGVALRVARKARRRSLARSSRLRLVAPETLSRTAGPELSPADHSALIHAEIDHLPERDRRPLILCALEGRTYEQAARTLGVSEPALRGRLHRARKRLEARLRARGVEVPSALIPPVPPAALLEAAIARATAASTVPGSISSLAKGAMLAMSLSSWKPAVFSSLATLGVVGAAALAQQAGPGPEKPQEGPPPAQAEAPKAKPPAPSGRPTEEEMEAKNAIIRALLAAPCPFDVSDQPDENIEMEVLLKRMKEASATPDQPGIAIYVSPYGLSIADKTMRSSTLFQPKGRPLGEALREYLALLGLGYAVDGGFLTIDSHASATDRRIDAVDRKLDALIKKLDSAPIFFEPANVKRVR